MIDQKKLVAWARSRTMQTVYMVRVHKRLGKSKKDIAYWKKQAFMYAAVVEALGGEAIDVEEAIDASEQIS